jgi:hypothetical protein
VGFANEARGLRIAGTGFSYLNEGAYGVVFADRAAGRIVKIYRWRPEQDHARAVFKAEADAYGLAASSKAVAALVPGNFRLCTAQQIIDKDGKDVTAEFFPDLALEMDFVAGHFLKIASIDGTEALRVRGLFYDVGIHHTIDMSVTLGADGAVAKAIDFAIVEHELMHSEW